MTLQLTRYGGCSVPEYRIDVWIKAAPEARKGWVQADSPDKVEEAFEDQIEECGDIFGATQDTGSYGDLDWDITEIQEVESGEVVFSRRTGPQAYFLAELSTRNFDFTAFGLTEDEARAAMQEGWRKHTEQALASDPGGPPMFTWEELAEDVNIRELVPGQCLRDGEPLSIIPF